VLVVRAVRSPIVIGEKTSRAWGNSGLGGVVGSTVDGCWRRVLQQSRDGTSVDWTEHWDLALWLKLFLCLRPIPPAGIEATRWRLGPARLE
jgi:hypothetical protein